MSRWKATVILTQTVEWEYVVEAVDEAKAIELLRNGETVDEFKIEDKEILNSDVQLDTIEPCDIHLSELANGDTFRVLGDEELSGDREWLRLGPGTAVDLETAECLDKGEQLRVEKTGHCECETFKESDEDDDNDAEGDPA